MSTALSAGPDPLRVPDRIDGYGTVSRYNGISEHPGEVQRAAVRFSSAPTSRGKVLPSIRAAIEACGLKDGGVISFHHHLRNGDHVMAMVIDEIARAGIANITIAPSSLFPIHATLVPHMGRGFCFNRERLLELRLRCDPNCRLAKPRFRLQRAIRTDRGTPQRI